jgi:hypothetical protein
MGSKLIQVNTTKCRNAGIEIMNLRNVFLCILWMTVQVLAVTSTARPQEQQHSKAEAAGQFIEENLGLTSQSFTLAQLRERIHPKKESGKVVPNLHVQGETDRIVVLNDGKGLEVEAYVTASGPVLINRITLTTADRDLPGGLRIGHSSLDAMYDAIGTDAENAKGPGGAFAKRYYNAEHTESALLWFNKDERLAGVEWKFEGD